MTWRVLKLIDVLSRWWGFNPSASLADNVYDCPLISLFSPAFDGFMSLDASEHEAIFSAILEKRRGGQ